MVIASLKKAEFGQNDKATSSSPRSRSRSPRNKNHHQERFALPCKYVVFLVLSPMYAWGSVRLAIRAFGSQVLPEDGTDLNFPSKSSFAFRGAQPYKKLSGRRSGSATEDSAENDMKNKDVRKRIIDGRPRAVPYAKQIGREVNFRKSEEEMEREESFSKSQTMMMRGRDARNDDVSTRNKLMMNRHKAIDTGRRAGDAKERGNKNMAISEIEKHATKGSRKQQQQQQQMLHFKDPIRTWGCGLKQTPFVFVHIGKAGGGTIRRRIAVSATNFERDGEDWAKTDLDDSYYPIYDGEDEELVAKARFCNSGHFNYRARAEKGHEGVLPCSASTPVGLAIACAGAPHNAQEEYCGGDPTKRESAHVVYVGHNNIGSELHWLPVPILEEWWRTHWASTNTSSNTHSTTNRDEITHAWKTLDGEQDWCDDIQRPLHHLSEKKRIQAYFACGKTKQEIVDKAALSALSQKGLVLENSSDRGKAYGAMYASLPVVRATMLRNPFSWLISKFLWHELLKTDMACDDVETATFGSNQPAKSLGSAKGPGWARRFALTYIYNLCGSDCYSRHLSRDADLEEITAQAEFNLRHSFAIVGVLEEGDEEFFKMIHSRIAYMDMTINLEKMPEDGDHSTSSRGQSKRCKERFEDVNFQAQLTAASPEIAALDRLYKVAVEVNLFQREELDQCEDSFFAVNKLSKDLEE